jgi:thioredoxin 1
MIRTGLSRAVVFVLLLPALARVQAPTPPTRNRASEANADFSTDCLTRWKAAVLSGDKSALAAFYSTWPPAQAKTPQGQSQDPSEEPQFWSTLASRGFLSLDAKILDVEKLQPGVVALVLRFEMSIKSSSGAEPFVVSGAQVWAEQESGWRIVMTQRSDLSPAPQMSLPEPATPNTDLYPSPEEARPEIDAALHTATKEHKRVILVFGGNWCFDCHVLDAAFRSAAIAPLVGKSYVVVHVNIGNFDRNLDLAKNYETTLDKGVPTLAVLGPDGKVVFSQKRGEFESAVRLGPDDIVRFLDKWKPGPVE